MNIKNFFNNKSKILENDNINLTQWEINTRFLNNLDEFTSPQNDEWQKERQRFLDKVTPVLVKIAMNIFRDPYRTPEFLKSNLKEHVWYLAAYPDVIDYFYPTSDHKGTQKDRDKLDKKCENASKMLDELESKLRDENINDINTYLIHIKNFYIEKGNNLLLLNK